MWRTLTRLGAVVAVALALYYAGHLSYLWCCGVMYRGVSATAVGAGQPAVRVERTMTGREMGQTIVLFWAGFLVAVSAAGAAAAWRGKVAGTGAAAFTLLLMVFLGAFSIGGYFLPAAAAMFLTFLLALFARITGRT